MKYQGSQFLSSIEFDLEDSSAAERELIGNIRENEQLLQVQYQIVDLDEFNALINDVFAP